MKNKDRPLAISADAEKRQGPSLVAKIAFVLGVVAIVVIVVSRLNLGRDMKRLDEAILSGSADGNYFAIGSDLSARAQKSGGHLKNITSAGSIENVKRLTAARENKTCDVSFALVQDGSDFGDAGKSGELTLIGRLPKSESVFFLGRDADKITEFKDLEKKKIGIGPEGSGVSLVATEILSLPEFKSLGVVLEHHSMGEQVALAKTGELDLAVVVMDEDAPFVANPIRDGSLQIAGFSHLDVIARRFPHYRVGRIGAGQYEALRTLPRDDKRVLRIDTLVVANGCAGRSSTIDLMVLVEEHFPDFIRHNKETANATGLTLSSAAKGFFDHEGPEIADEFAPWLVDLMPPANWAYIVAGVSLLFNAMGAGHRFRLWRIDDARVKLEAEISHVFGDKTTLGDIEHLDAKGELASDETKTRIRALVDRLELLAARSRRQSLSMLVPMGQEMAYRYQEGVIYETLAVLRAFLRRAESKSA